MAGYLDSLVVTWPAWALVSTLAISVVALWKGADWLVEDAVAISRRYGVPQVVIGATFISLGTTMPEAVVSVLAAVNGRSEMALGNAVGSIICDTGLILGVGCLITPLPFDRQVADRQGWVQIATGLLLVAACVPWADPTAAFVSGGRLSQAAGFAFLGLLVVYIGWSLHLARQATSEDAGDPDADPRSLLRTATSLMAGVAVVVLSSSVLIASAAELANRLEIPPAIIAATLVAFGTSLPELTVVVTAALKRQGGLAIGNVIGADILNVLFVAGAAAAVTPTGLEANHYFFQMQFPAMLILLAIFRVGLWRAPEGTLRRGFGVLLLVVYVAVTLISYLLAGTVVTTTGT